MQRLIVLLMAAVMLGGSGLEASATALPERTANAVNAPGTSELDRAADGIEAERKGNNKKKKKHKN